MRARSSERRRSSAQRRCSACFPAIRLIRPSAHSGARSDRAESVHPGRPICPARDGDLEPELRHRSSGNSPGTLTVAATVPLPFDPGFLPGLTQINNPAQTEYDVGGYEQVLPHFTVACNEPPSLPDPNRFSDPDSGPSGHLAVDGELLPALPEPDPERRSPTRWTHTPPSCRSWRRDCRRRCAMFRRSSPKAQSAFAPRAHEPRPSPCCVRPSLRFIRRSRSSFQTIRKRAVARFATATSSLARWADASVALVNSGGL